MFTMALPASAATKRTVSLNASSTSVTAGAKVTLSGKVTKSPKGTKVRIERLVGRRWTALKTVKTTGKKGAYKTSVSVASTTSFRAVAPKTKNLKATTSTVRTVKVRVAATPPSAPATPGTPGTPPSNPEPPTIASTVKISQGANGVGADGDSTDPSISADGRYVTYASDASNIAPGHVRGSVEVYLHDRQTGLTRRVTSPATQAGRANVARKPTISGDGRFIVYVMNTKDVNDEFAPYSTERLYSWDSQTGSTVVVTPESIGPETDANRPVAISADGRYVAYNGQLSGSGNAVHALLWDRELGTTTTVGQVTAAFNAEEEYFRFVEGPALSADGRYVLYDSYLERGFTTVLEWDRQTGTTRTVPQAMNSATPNGSSDAASISADGRYVMYESAATNLTPNDDNEWTDLFVWDRQTGTTVQAVRASYQQGVFSTSISGNGRFITYTTRHSNLPQEGEIISARHNVYLLDRVSGKTVQVSRTPRGGGPDAHSLRPIMSSDGRYVAYESYARNIVAGDSNELGDIFLWDYATCLANEAACSPPPTDD